MLIRDASKVLTESFVFSLVGKFVHVTDNLLKLEVAKGIEEYDLWFGGRVAGFEKSLSMYDFKQNDYITEAEVEYRLILTDGAVHTLSNQCKIEQYEEKEFMAVLQNYILKQV